MNSAPEQCKVHRIAWVDAEKRASVVAHNAVLAVRAGEVGWRVVGAAVAWRSVVRHLQGNINRSTSTEVKRA